MFNAEKQLKDLGANINVFECKGLGHSIDEIGIKKGIDFIKECTPWLNYFCYNNNIQLSVL